MPPPPPQVPANDGDVEGFDRSATVRSLPSRLCPDSLGCLPVAPETLARAKSVDRFGDSREWLLSEQVTHHGGDNLFPAEVASPPALAQAPSAQIQSLFNGTLISTGSAGRSKPPVIESQSVDLDTPVINEISPLSDETPKLDVAQETARQGVTSAVAQGPALATESATSGSPQTHVLSSAILYPLKTSKSVHTGGIFKERTADLRSANYDLKSLPSNESIDSYVNSVSSVVRHPPRAKSEPETPEINLSDKDPPSKSTSKYKICSMILGLLLALSLAGFIPSVIILALGTKPSVLKYLERNGFQNGPIKDYLEQHSPQGFLSASPMFSEQYISSSSNSSDKYIQRPHYNIFHGLAYSPKNAMEPACGLSPKEISLDISKISTVTSRIRNYGMQCNQTEYILDAIQNLGLNMTVAIGVWIGSNSTINELQLETMRRVVQSYPEHLFETIFIGNEVLFREDLSVTELIRIILETKKYVNSLGYKIPVGTSEIGSLISPELLQACDIVGANIHPFFGGENVDRASEWALNFLRYQLEPINLGNTTIAITEVGWPSSGGNYQSALASVSNIKKFVSDFVCKAKDLRNPWYFFEAFDEPWKEVFYEKNNQWETEWGIFTDSRADKFDWKDILQICTNC